MRISNSRNFYLSLLKTNSKMKSIIFLIILLTTVGCTDNSKARGWGGTEEITLNPHERLLTMTWKESSLWLLTVDTISGINYFREKSPYGVMEGQVIVKRP